ncbi:hypothetical protein NQ318_003042 [Aromia moschata]|uniref:Uncharacterized protein n=1 Tax=Aromia moschata TaxID=1265417 RepID=A0AAV8X0M5_9CUCU|nr:hypothetical protein NQ318_003042 [Aromia moschata]
MPRANLQASIRSLTKTEHFAKGPNYHFNRTPLRRIVVHEGARKTPSRGSAISSSSVRDKFWLISGRNLARKVVHGCVRCFRAKPRMLAELEILNSIDDQ